MDTGSDPIPAPANLQPPAGPPNSQTPSEASPLRDPPPSPQSPVSEPLGEIIWENSLKPMSDRMADPRLIAALAMNEMSETFQKYTRLARDLHSDHLPTLASARSNMLDVYRFEFPELCSDTSPDEFEAICTKAFVDSFSLNMEYIENLRAGEILALFTPWLRSSYVRNRRRVRSAPPPTPAQSSDDEKTDEDEEED